MDEALRTQAARLLGQPPAAAEAVAGGGNSRLFRLEDRAGRRYALKVYPSRQHDPRDRLGAEFTALSFLHRHGVREVPAALACDQEHGLALYEWIEGARVAGPDDGDIDAALAFARRLRALGSAGDELPLASEACLSGGEILAQLHRRLDRLATVPELAALLTGRLIPLRERAAEGAQAGYRRLGRDFDTPLPPALRCLSPSDFGFHNALRRDDGSLVFLDFEYFGWDDPVKLTADFIQHPGMALDAALADRFVAGACALYGDEDGFAARLGLLAPLIGLRWALILLNEFLPERWSARQFAGFTDRAAVLDRQRGKAMRQLDRVDAWLRERRP